MGVIVNKENEKNTELSKRISADLRAKAAEAKEDVDLAEDAEYLKNLRKTSKFGWVWVVLIVLAILSLVFILLF